MKTVNDLFGYWESMAEMAADVGESQWTVAKWKSRGRIPDWAWESLIEALRARGCHVTPSDLLALNNAAMPDRRQNTAI